MRIQYTIALVLILFVGTTLYFFDLTRQPIVTTLAPDTTAALIIQQPTPVTLAAIPVRLLSNLYSTEHLSIKSPADAHRYDNIQLYPIYASSAFLDYHKNLGPYLSLQEGLQQGKIQITEQGGRSEAEVNTLLIENLSRDTVIILGGEVVRGGKQDRMIATDFFLPPHSGKIDLAVYCVEHGRWAEEGTLAFNVTLGLAPLAVREAASDSAGQQRVWDEVAKLDVAYDVAAPTMALAAAEADEDMKEYLAPYLETLLPIQWPTQVVGFVAVMDNHIIACDVFAQHALLKKYYATLVRSYCGRVHDSKYESLPAFSTIQQHFQVLFKDEATLDARLTTHGTQLKNGRYRIHASVYY